ncbi:MAG TPA: TetR-like C-terminal domain-containing protein [Streptosporangiaceae bacterium]|nr:TetR-like C-terminal domain-containing protein [Streptosporangiaceae bacterium]
MTGTKQLIQPGAPRRNNRRGQGERLRADLLAAADAIVTETGSSAALSLRAVAARVGVAATSVYLHFDSVQSLKMALAQRCFADFTAFRAAAADHITDPAQRLVASCQAYARYGIAHPGRYRLMFGADLPALTAADAQRADVQPDPAAPAEPSRAAFAALVQAVAGCQQAGLAPAGTNPTLLALLVWTALHGQVALRIDRPGYPWPPADIMISEAVTRLVSLPGAGTRP